MKIYEKYLTDGRNPVLRPGPPRAVEIDYLCLKKNKRLRKKFKDEKAMQKWIADNEGDFRDIRYSVGGKRVETGR